MNAQTIEYMKRLKLTGMLRAFQNSLQADSGAISADELLAMLVEAEWDERQNRSVQRYITNAHFRYKASLEHLQYSASRNLDKNQIGRFAECTYITACENILITGSTGCGKSYLASALGYQACSMGYRVVYANTAKLFAKLKMAKADSSYVKELSKLERQHLLILDDFGLQPLDAQSRNFLMEIMEDRHGKSSTIITSQVPVRGWHEIIAEDTIADAILDRLVHSAHRIELGGDSMRKRQTSTQKSDATDIG